MNPFDVNAFLSSPYLNDWVTSAPVPPFASNFTVYALRVYLTSTTVEPSALTCTCAMDSGAVNPVYVVFATATVSSPIVPVNASVAVGSEGYEPSTSCR